VRKSDESNAKIQLSLKASADVMDEKKRDRKKRFKSFKQKESSSNLRADGVVDPVDLEEFDLPDLKMFFDGVHYKVFFDFSICGLLDSFSIASISR
jgi:hypothetical protein